MLELNTPAAESDCRMSEIVLLIYPRPSFGPASLSLLAPRKRTFATLVGQKKKFAKQQAWGTSSLFLARRLIRAPLEAHLDSWPGVGEESLL